MRLHSRVHTLSTWETMPGDFNVCEPECGAPWMVARVQACPNVNPTQTAVLRAITHRAHAYARGA